MFTGEEVPQYDVPQDRSAVSHPAARFTGASPQRDGGISNRYRSPGRKATAKLLAGTFRSTKPAPAQTVGDLPLTAEQYFATMNRKQRRGFTADAQRSWRRKQRVDALRALRGRFVWVAQ